MSATKPTSPTETLQAILAEGERHLTWLRNVRAATEAGWTGPVCHECGKPTDDDGSKFCAEHAPEPEPTPWDLEEARVWSRADHPVSKARGK
jgi:hypothetical protein